jgi:hypothetical protein
MSEVEVENRGKVELLSLPTEGRLMEKEELVARTGWSIKTIEELQASQQIPFIKLGRMVRYEWRAVQEALRSQFGIGYPEQGKVEQKGKGGRAA